MGSQTLDHHSTKCQIHTKTQVVLTQEVVIAIEDPILGVTAGQEVLHTRQTLVIHDRVHIAGLILVAHGLDLIHTGDHEGLVLGPIVVIQMTATVLGQGHLEVDILGLVHIHAQGLGQEVIVIGHIHGEAVGQLVTLDQEAGLSHIAIQGLTEGIGHQTTAGHHEGLVCQVIGIVKKLK